MELEKNINANIEMNFDVFHVDGEFTTQPAPIGKFWSHYTSYEYDFDKIFSEIKLPDGKYRVEIKIVKTKNI